MGNVDFGLVLERSRPDRAAVLLLGQDPLTQPLDVLGAMGCNLYVGRIVASLPATTDASGSVELRAKLRNRADLAGVGLNGQWIVLDPMAPGGFAATTHGLGLTVR